MKKETKELVRTLAIALVVMMVVPLAYRVCIYFWPPEEKPHPTLAEFLKEAESANCIQLLKKPISKWSDEEAKLEPEIYLWLKEEAGTVPAILLTGSRRPVRWRFRNHRALPRQTVGM